MTDQEMKHASHIQHTMPVRTEASMSATFIVDDDWMYLLLNLYFLDDADANSSCQVYPLLNL